MNGTTPPANLLSDSSRQNGGGWRANARGQAWFHVQPSGAPEYWAARLSKGKSFLDVRWNSDGSWYVVRLEGAP